MLSCVGVRGRCPSVEADPVPARSTGEPGRTCLRVVSAHSANEVGLETTIRRSPTIGTRGVSLVDLGRRADSLAGLLARFVASVDEQASTPVAPVSESRLRRLRHLRLDGAGRPSRLGHKSRPGAPTALGRQGGRCPDIPHTCVGADPVCESAPTVTRMFGLTGGETQCTVEQVTAQMGPCARHHFSTRLAVAL